MRTRQLLIAVGSALILLCVACQPDQRQPIWSADGGGTQSDVGDGGQENPGPEWTGEWSSLPSTRGGFVMAELDDEIIVSDDRSGGVITAVSSDGQTWRDPESSPIASRISAGGSVYYAETETHRYLLAPTENSRRQLFRAPVGSDDWQEIGDFSEVEFIESLHELDGQLAVTGARGAFLRQSGGGWTNISLNKDRPGFMKLWVGGSTLFSLDAGVVLVSTDQGQSWSGTEGVDPIHLGLYPVVPLEDDLYALGQAFIGAQEDRSEADQFLLSSSEGKQWDTMKLSHERWVDYGSLTAYEGQLYALDGGGRLLRLSTDGSIVTVTDEAPARLNRAGSLYAVGSRLVTSLGQGAIATWAPGDSRWTIAPVANDASLFDARDGRVWARSGVVQSVGNDDWTWERDWTFSSADIWTTSDGWLGHEPEHDCLYLHTGSSWKAALQWTDEEIRSNCTDEDPLGKMTDAVTYRDGYAVARNSVSLTTGGGPTDTDEVGEGGLIHWNPQTGETSQLVPDGLEFSDRPGVRGLANVGGTLWVQTDFGQGLPGDDGTLYRIRDGDWTSVEPDVIGPDGTRYEQFSKVVTKELRGYKNTLIAEVLYSASRESDRSVALAAWNPQTQAFEVLPMPSGQASKKSFTDLGPVAVTSDTLWRYRAQRGEWQQIGEELPTDGEKIAKITAEPGAFYLNSTSGDVWVTRADEDGG